jgi:hypothetical protein
MLVVEWLHIICQTALCKCSRRPAPLRLVVKMLQTACKRVWYPSAWCKKPECRGTEPPAAQPAVAGLCCSGTSHSIYYSAGMLVAGAVICCATSNPDSMQEVCANTLHTELALYSDSLLLQKHNWNRGRRYPEPSGGTPSST